jgi:SAM-dependent methyltransferase
MNLNNGLENPWKLILSRPYLSEMALTFQDLHKRAVWSQALFEGGNTLKLWNEAVELKIALLAVCAVEKGQRLALIGKYCEESGFAPAVRSIIGPGGNLSVEEVLPGAFASIKTPPVPGRAFQWDFPYLDSLPQKSLDRVILFNAASHIANLESFAQQIKRVLADDGRVIIAESPWGGKDLLSAARLDGHLYGILTLALGGMGLKEEDLSQTGPEDLKEVFQPILNWSRSVSWKGLYLFYGQKGYKDGEAPFGFPRNTEAVKAFLKEQPCKSPWELLSSSEASVLGSEVADVDAQRALGRVASFGPGLDWTYLKYKNIVKLMYDNLKAKPGSRVLVIGEVLEGLGFLSELRKRVGNTGEIAKHEISEIHLSMFLRLWSGADIPPDNRHQYEYPFADQYPDNYFDVVWLPQGVHHAKSWKATAPRLLRVLKPGGQIMMIESRICEPDFFIAVNQSGLLKCMAEKLWWSLGVTFEEMPDYPTAHLAAAFGDSLTDTFGIDPEGWLVFWGYKK